MGACGPVGSTVDSEYYLIFYSVAVILEAAGLLCGPWGSTAVGIAWDGRGWPRHGTGRDLLLRLAAEAVLRIEARDTLS